MVKPYPTDKIYESSNVNKCAKKFYQILKQDNEKYNFFIIKNIENNDYYKFQIGNNNHNVIIGGGDNAEKKQDSTKIEQKIEQKIEEKKDNELINRVEKLESRVSNLEKKEEKQEKEEKKDNNSDNSDKSESEGGKLNYKPKRGLIPPPKNEKNICLIM